ncbi:MAG TPA: GAF domain-containing protein, partial [Microthrixaceae bacterium]|nr:GAF domain-containing protein [Microthrixaceae bacterium]
GFGLRVFADAVDTGWFPWGLAPLAADRFVLIDYARALPADHDGARTLGELGVRSCLHLPLRQRGRTVGALQVFWSEPRLAWDDDRGRLLRTLGRFLLTCDGRVRT